jgi:hypothetical protein
MFNVLIAIGSPFGNLFIFMVDKPICRAGH